MQADLQAELGEKNGCRLDCRLTPGKKTSAGWLCRLTSDKILGWGGSLQAELKQKNGCRLDCRHKLGDQNPERDYAG